MKAATSLFPTTKSWAQTQIVSTHAPHVTLFPLIVDMQQFQFPIAAQPDSPLRDLGRTLVQSIEEWRASIKMGQMIAAVQNATTGNPDPKNCSNGGPTPCDTPVTEDPTQHQLIVAPHIDHAFESVCQHLEKAEALFSDTKPTIQLKDPTSTSEGTIAAPMSGFLLQVEDKFHCFIGTLPSWFEDFASGLKKDLDSCELKCAMLAAGVSQTEPIGVDVQRAPALDKPHNHPPGTSPDHIHQDTPLTSVGDKS